MAAPKIKPATYEDLLALPDDVVGEIVDGELVAMPRPRPRHANVAIGGASSLGGYQGTSGGGGSRRDGPGGWLLLVEPEVHWGTEVAVPDLAGWRRDRLPRVPDTAAVEIPPDWAMEIISPRTARHDRGAKRRMYARWGVEWLWFADPDSRVVETLQLRDGEYVVKGTWGDDDLMVAEPFPLAEIPLAYWWGD